MKLSGFLRNKIITSHPFLDEFLGTEIFSFMTYIIDAFLSLSCLSTFHFGALRWAHFQYGSVPF